MSVKPLALERGLTPKPGWPGLYSRADKPGDDLVFDKLGQCAEYPKCRRCHDVHYVNVRPANRPSRGAWDWDLVPCECVGEA